MTYPGGKNGAGVYQAIINQMPPHQHYVEPFCGGGAILLNKRPAARSTIIDLDGEPLTAVCDEARRRGWKIAAVATDALPYLEKQGPVWEPDTLCYCDPPYVMSTRSGRRIYRHEMTDADHARLLAALKALRCMVILSGYDNLLYRAELGDWRRVTFTGCTRGGPREEVLWCNFPEPASLHDYRYLGGDYRERERIRKKANRWQANFAALPALERRAILSALQRIETRLGDQGAPPDLSMGPGAPPEASRDPAPPEAVAIDDRLPPGASVPTSTPPEASVRSTPDPAGGDSGTARPVGGSSRPELAARRPLSPSSSTNTTAGGDELSERGRHKGGFPQSGPISSIAAPGGELLEDGPWPPRVLP